MSETQPRSLPKFMALLDKYHNAILELTITDPKETARSKVAAAKAWDARRAVEKMYRKGLVDRVAAEQATLKEQELRWKKWKKQGQPKP